MKNPTTKSSEFLLSRIAQSSRLTGKILDSELAPLGLSLQDLRIAGLLMGETQITQKDLAEKLSVRAATLSVALKKLESQGLLTKQTSQIDKRVQHLKLNKTKRISKVDGLLKSVQNRLCKGIAKSDLRIAESVITTLIANAKQEIET